MMALYEATRRGNFPAIKPYCGTDDMIRFNQAALNYLHLDEAMQAVPLPGEWFGQLDGRGPLNPKEAVRAHMEVGRFFAEKDVPVESNYAHHYGLRYSHDVIVVASHGLAAATANICGIKDYIAQFMFNTPPISSWGDYSRMSAALELARKIRGDRPLHVETRGGLMYFSPYPKVAKRELATTTLLQMYLDPMLMHVVNYCEADHAAQVRDIEESALIALQAATDFKNYREDLPDFDRDPKVIERKQTLLQEARLLLTEIGKLGGYRGVDIVADDRLEEYLTPEVIDKALHTGLLQAPGVSYPAYPKSSDVLTAVKNGCVYAINPKTWKKMGEAERIDRLEL